jgi:hypothetical protein
MHQSIKYSIYEAVIIVIVFNDFFYGVQAVIANTRIKFYDCSSLLMYDHSETPCYLSSAVFK